MQWLPEHNMELPKTERRIAVATLGCKVNQYDTSVVERLVRQRGWRVVPFDQAADAYVVNSCSVTDRADAESRQLARRARRQNPQAKVILTGCFAQVAPHRAAIPEVDYVVGLNRIDDLLRAIAGELEMRIAVDELRTARRIRTVGGGVVAGHTRAFLKVQEGCNLFCSFCIVPFSRGASRSLSEYQVLDELRRMEAEGVVEVVLTGVHLGAWGSDLRPQREVADLVETLLARTSVPRIRLSSLDPPEVSPRLLDLFTRSDRLCPHLHIPIQAGHDEVLRRMRRRYDTAFVGELLREIQRRLPDASIGTDVIAGFPGETEEQFEMALAWLDSLPIHYFHVFPYSRRSGTTAAKMEGQLPRQIVRKRAKRLRSVDAAHRSAFARRFVGRMLRVLVERVSGNGGVGVGYSQNYLRVHAVGVERTNMEVSVLVEGVHETGVWGRCLA